MKPGLRSITYRQFLLLLICFTIHTGSYSQAIMFGNEKVKWEAGFQFGPSFFLGDLGGNAGHGTPFLKDLNLEFTKMMKGAFIAVYPVKWAGIRVQGNLTYLEGDDAVINTNGINELWRKQRNLDFRSKVWELQGLVEFFPTMLLVGEGDFEPRLRPYVAGGLGIFHFNPEGSLTDANGNKSWYFLKPLRTEGEGMSEYPYSKEYNLTQLNIPFSAGLKYYISDRVNFSTEVLYRKSFTDYIDDVSKRYINSADRFKYMTANQASLSQQISDKTIGIIYPGMTDWPPGTQRGDLKDADAYFSVIARIGIRLGPIYSSSFNRNAARQTRCPSVF
jgi:hypothetical protein